MTFADLAQIVTSLRVHHRISTARASRLMTDLRHGAASCGRQRSTAVGHIATDAAPARNTLLTAAAAALRFNHC